MMRRYLSFLIIFSLLVFTHCDEKKDTPEKNKSTQKKVETAINNDDFGFGDDIKELEKEKEDEKKVDEKNPDDGSWVILINEKKISPSVFEKAYYKFNKMSPRKVTKKQFVNVYLQNHILKGKVKANFRKGQNKKVLNFIKRQAVVEHYIKQKGTPKRVKSPSRGQLKAFHQQVITQPGFGNLSLKKHRRKLTQLYKNQQKNKHYIFFEQSLYGQFRIKKNDEWEDDLISKYVNKKVPLKMALGKNHRKFWLYKILLDKPKKKNVKKKKKIENKTVPVKAVVKKDDEKVAKLDKTKKDVDKEKKIDKLLSDDINKTLEYRVGDNKEKRYPDPGKVYAFEELPDKTKKKIVKKHVAVKDEKKIEKSVQNRVEKKQEIEEKETAKIDPALKALLAKKGIDYQNAIVFTIKDIEDRIAFLQSLNMNPMLASNFRKNIMFRKQYVSRFLIEELIYRRLKKTGLINSYKYREIANRASENYALNYYMTKVMKLKTPQQRQRYVMDYISSHQIKISQKYFDPSL